VYVFHQNVFQISNFNLKIMRRACSYSCSGKKKVSKIKKSQWSEKKCGKHVFYFGWSIRIRTALSSIHEFLLVDTHSSLVSTIRSINDAITSSKGLAFFVSEILVSAILLKRFTRF
jgi:hypothetical protein